jgi:hypothetical protein
MRHEAAMALTKTQEHKPLVGLQIPSPDFALCMMIMIDDWHKKLLNYMHDTYKDDGQKACIVPDIFTISITKAKNSKESIAGWQDIGHT